MSGTRLGSIRYINSMPVDYGIVAGAVPFDGTVFRDVPAALNKHLLQGTLDISPVSSLFYAEHSSGFKMLGDFVISSFNGVRSVLLFSKRPIEELEGSRIALTSEGKTTPALLQILFAKRYGIEADFVVRPDAGPALLEPSFDAALLIGDEALIASETPRAEIRVYDLAEEWTAWTKLPFVFALWAARRDYAHQSADEMAATERSLKQSRGWGARNAKIIVREASRQTGLGESRVERYFGELSYGLDSDMKRGLELFVRYARELCLVSSSTKPEPVLVGNAHIVV